MGLISFGATYNLTMPSIDSNLYALRRAAKARSKSLQIKHCVSLDRKFAESLDDYYADVSEIPECGRDCSGTGSTVSSGSCCQFSGDQQCADVH